MSGIVVLLWLLLLLIHTVCMAGNLTTQPVVEQGCRGGRNIVGDGGEGGIFLFQ